MNRVKIKLKAGEKKSKKDKWTRTFIRFSIITLFLISFSREDVEFFREFIDSSEFLRSMFGIVLLVFIAYPFFSNPREKNKLNCSYCEKELEVRYPEENLECSKCKTLHVIDWDKE